MSRERQKRQSEEVRTRILETAKRIVSEEGVDALSIRRLTKEMEYSTGIVYHYFDNKDQILDCVMQDSYQNILRSVQAPDQHLKPDESLRITISRFIEGVLHEPEAYKMIMLNTSPQVLGFTSVLGEGCVEKRSALMALASTLEIGISDGLFAPCDTHITAQVIWSSVFGLLMRLIIERDITPQQRSRLINRLIDFILKGLRP